MLTTIFRNRLRMTTGMLAALAIGGAIQVLMPMSVKAEESDSTWRLMDRLQNQISDAEMVRGRLELLRDDMTRVRRGAEASRDMVLAGCLLPHENRASDLYSAATGAYNGLLAGMTEEDLDKISHNLEMLSLIESLTRKVEVQRDGCRGRDTVVYVQTGPRQEVQAEPQRPVKPIPATSSSVIASAGADF